MGAKPVPLPDAKLREQQDSSSSVTHARRSIEHYARRDMQTRWAL